MGQLPLDEFALGCNTHHVHLTPQPGRVRGVKSQQLWVCHEGVSLGPVSVWWGHRPVVCTVAGSLLALGPPTLRALT